MSSQYTPLEEHLLAAVECADLGDHDGAAEHLRQALSLDPRPSLDRALRDIEETADPSTVDLRVLLADELAAFPSGVEAGSSLGALDDDFFGAELVVEAPIDESEASSASDAIPELDLDDLAPITEEELLAAHGGDDQVHHLEDDLGSLDLDELIDTEALDRHTGDHDAADDSRLDVSDVDGAFRGDDTLGGVATQSGAVTVPVPLQGDEDDEHEPPGGGVLDEPETAPGNLLIDPDDDSEADEGWGALASGGFDLDDVFADATDDTAEVAGVVEPEHDDLGSDSRSAHAGGARYRAQAPPPPTHRRRSSPVDTHAGVGAQPVPEHPVIDDDDDDEAWELEFAAPATTGDHNEVEVESNDPDDFARAISGMRPPGERVGRESDAAATVETDVVDAPLPPPRRRRSGAQRGTSLSTRPVPLVDDDALHPPDAATMSAAPPEPRERQVATAPGMRAMETPELALARARALRDRGDIASALQTVDAIIERDPNDHRAHALRKSLQRQLAALRMSQLEPLDRVPTVAGSPAGLTPRSMFLLTFVDGMSTLQDIIDLSGLPPADAGELLLELMDAGAIAVR